MQLFILLARIIQMVFNALDFFKSCSKLTLTHPSRVYLKTAFKVMELNNRNFTSAYQFAWFHSTSWIRENLAFVFENPFQASLRTYVPKRYPFVGLYHTINSPENFSSDAYPFKHPFKYTLKYPFKYQNKETQH